MKSNIQEALEIITNYLYNYHIDFEQGAELHKVIDLLSDQEVVCPHTRNDISDGIGGHLMPSECVLLHSKPTSPVKPIDKEKLLDLAHRIQESEKSKETKLRELWERVNYDKLDSKNAVLSLIDILMEEE